MIYHIPIIILRVISVEIPIILIVICFYGWLIVGC